MISKPRSCNRCDWTSDTVIEVPPREQAADHARSSGHWLCSVCTHSLDPTEPVVCERCLTRTRSRLQEIVELYALLPEELEHQSAPAALVLLGPGSEGTASRDMTPGEWRALAGATDHKLGLPGHEHHVDNRPEDGASVVFILRNWELDWRETWGEPPPIGPATALGITGYLERRARTAANGDHERPPHPAFAEFATELAKLLEQIESATHRDDRPARAPVECFSCGHRGSLRRTYRTPDPCEHKRPSFPGPYVVDRAGDVVLGPDSNPSRRPIADRRAQHDRELERWRSEHARCDQGGLAARWACRLCEVEYDDEQYMLALSYYKAWIVTSEAWGLPWEVAASLGLAVSTVRRWAERLQVTSMCDRESQRMMVWWPDVLARAEQLRARAHAREVRKAARKQA